MSVAKDTNPSNKRFGLKKILLILLSAIVFIGTVSYIAFETVTADVVVIQDGEKINTKTTAENVNGVMDELGIDVTKHDDLSVDLDEEVTDGMVIEYTKAHNVSVTIDNQTKEFYTTKDTVKEFLNEESIKLNEHDDISVDLKTQITDGLNFKIKKAFEVTINVGGKKQTKMVTNQTVGDLLKDLNIKLDENDRLNAKLDESVKDQRSIEIVRVTKETVTKEVEIPYQTETRKDSDMLRGNSTVLQYGQEGKKVQTYEVTKENGQEVSRKLIDEKVVKDSINHVVAKGTKVPVQQVSAEGGEWINFTSTKYTAFCPSGCRGVTATGVDVSDTIYYNGMRIVAVDPDVIPLWSIVEVKTPNETFTAIALDTGGSIDGKDIDILVDSRQEAINWGYRTVQVRIIEKN